MTSIRLLLIAGLFAGCGVLAWAVEPAYRSKSLTPQHKRELQISIQKCAERVNSSRDLETRSQCQEELCQRLIQAEEYDNALHVARAIYETQGIDEERKAAHHFLMAQILALKMEASPSVDLMEQNRRLALESAKQVAAKRYPVKWGVGDAARQLIVDLQNPQRTAEVRGRVLQRQGGGSTPALTSAGDAHLAYSAPAARPNARVSFSRVTAPDSAPAGSVSPVNITRNDFAAAARRRNEADNVPAPARTVGVARSTGLAALGGEGNRQAMTELGSSLDRTLRSTTVLDEPIIVDGMGPRLARSRSDGASGRDQLSGNTKETKPSKVTGTAPESHPSASEAATLKNTFRGSLH